MLVGSEASVSTWGKFRCAYGLNTSDLTISAHSADYASGLKSAADGSGLIRIDKSTVRSAIYYQPTFNNTWTDIPDNENIIAILGGSQTVPQYPATDEVAEELVGETLSFDNGSVTIASSLMELGSQIEMGPPDLGSVVSVGKLTAF